MKPPLKLHVARQILAVSHVKVMCATKKGCGARIELTALDAISNRHCPRCDAIDTLVCEERIPE